MAEGQLTRWPHQVFGVEEFIRKAAAGCKRICVTTPTGGGKSHQMSDLIDWALKQGWYVAIYSDRKILTERLSSHLDEVGIDYGIRAADYDDEHERRVQICSFQTEDSRVLKRKQHELHPAGLVLVDEAHKQTGRVAREIFRRHLDQGAILGGFTATPLGLEGLYDELIIAGTVSELRACGALVPAYHFGCDEPDLRKIKPQPNGEYSEPMAKRAMMTPTIWGRVVKWFRILNPEQKPTVLFAPSVDTSLWFAGQFKYEGITAAHIDGEDCWIDGKLYKSDKDARAAVLAGIKSGDIKVVCNRYVLREAIDVPEFQHIILATIMGLQSYIQSCGRGLRAAPWVGKTCATIQDHGGHFWRHASVNADRAWELEQTAHIITEMRADAFRWKNEAEPISCPKCRMVRKVGKRCPKCGFEVDYGKRSRSVVQLDGSLREHEGDVFKPRRVAVKKNTHRLWTDMYHRAKNSRNGMTFNQAAALFFRENYYYPPRDLPFMPTDASDWFRRVRAVPFERLTGYRRSAGEEAETQGSLI